MSGDKYVFSDCSPSLGPTSTILTKEGYFFFLTTEEEEGGWVDTEWEEEAVIAVVEKDLEAWIEEVLETTWRWRDSRNRRLRLQAILDNDN